MPKKDISASKIKQNQPSNMSEKWPLFEVFVRSKLAHVHAGSLHAADSEMAMTNARDVYTRRNEGVSLWVIPSDLIFAWNFDGDTINAEQVYEHPQLSAKPVMANTVQQWEVFFRTKQGLSHKHVGSAMADNATTAIADAIKIYGDSLKITNVWVVPSTQINASDPTESESFYDPAENKLFRHATFYDLPDEVKHM